MKADLEIQKKMKATSKELGLRVKWLKNKDDLRQAFDEGLAKLYQDIFAGPPYNEVFTKAESEDVFSSVVDANGLAFITVDPKDKNKPISFVLSIPVTAKEHICDFVKSAVDVNKTTYFTEDGTRKEWRRRGISSKMKKLLIESNFAIGVKEVLLRTSIYSYDQISAVYKAGGIPMSGMVQDVQSMRADGQMESDKRSYYLFNEANLNNGHKPWVLPHVVVHGKGGNDVVKINSLVEEAHQKPVISLLQDLYPGTGKVHFSGGGNNGAHHPSVNPEEVLFDGRMYMPGHAVKQKLVL